MYPVVFAFTRQLRHSRILVLLRPLLILPHVAWVNIYAGIAFLVWVVAGVSIVITGRHPRGMWDILDGFFRYACKVNAYTLNLADTYPPFSGGSDHPFPLRLSCHFSARMSRVGVLFRPVLLVPHLLLAISVSLCTLMLLPVLQVSVLVLGRIPGWQWEVVVGQFIYQSRVLAYALLLTDAYPPFNGAQPLAAAEYFQDNEMGEMGDDRDVD